MIWAVGCGGMTASAWRARSLASSSRRAAWDGGAGLGLGPAVGVLGVGAGGLAEQQHVRAEHQERGDSGPPRERPMKADPMTAT